MTGFDRTARVRAADPARTPSDSDAARIEAADHRGMNEGMRVLSYLIAGPLCYGGLGWLGDRFFQTGFLVPVGVLVGTALSIVLIIRRYARSDS